MDLPDRGTSCLRDDDAKLADRVRNYLNENVVLKDTFLWRLMQVLPTVYAWLTRRDNDGRRAWWRGLGDNTDFRVLYQLSVSSDVPRKPSNIVDAINKMVQKYRETHADVSADLVENANWLVGTLVYLGGATDELLATITTENYALKRSFDRLVTMRLVIRSVLASAVAAAPAAKKRVALSETLRSMSTRRSAIAVAEWKKKYLM